MEDEIRLSRKIDRREGAGAFFASLALHGLLLLVLTSTSTFLPVTGSAASFEIFWFSVSAFPAASTDRPPLSRVSRLNLAADQEHPKPGAGEPQTPKPRPASAAGTATEPGPGVEEADAEETGISAAAKPLPPGKPPTAPGPFAPATSAVIPDASTLVLAGERRAGAANDKLGWKARTADVAGIAGKRMPQTPPRHAARPAPETVQQHHQATGNPVTDRPQPLPAPAAKTPLGTGAKAGSPLPTPAAKPTDPPEKRDSGSKGTRDEARPTETGKEEHLRPPAQEPPEPKGLVLPAVHGDLALFVTGSAEIKIGFLFRDYPKSRRSRGMTRAEARRTYPVVAVLVKTKEQERQAVIEKTMDGVYLFYAETEGGQPAEASFALELFGSRSGRSWKPLGSRRVSGRVVLGKVLMPEGILWEDMSAFTGSLMDSDSTTRFNATTGLIWKEFTE